MFAACFLALVAPLGGALTRGALMHVCFTPFNPCLCYSVTVDPLVLGVVRSTSLRPDLLHVSTTHNVVMHCLYDEVILSSSIPGGGDVQGAKSDLLTLMQSVSQDISTQPLTLHCCNIPLLITPPVVSAVDRIHEQFGVVISVVTTSGDFISFPDFVANISSLKPSGSSDNLLLVSEVSRFAEMKMSRIWRYEDASGQKRNFPPSINSLLNKKFYPFRNGTVGFSLDSIKYSIDFSRMVVVQEGCELFGKIDNEPPVWRYSDSASVTSAASPTFSRAFDAVTSQEIDLAVHYGALGLLQLGESQVSFDTLSNPMVLHDFTNGSRWFLCRNPPLSESRDCMLTLAVRCRRVDWPQIELALSTLLENQVTRQIYSMPPNIAESLECLLVNIARQFCIKTRVVVDLTSPGTLGTPPGAPTRPLQLEGEREYTFAVKVHLLEVFQQKIAPLAMEMPLALPQHWKQGQRSPVLTVAVPVGTEEWRELEDLLRQSLPRVRLVEITRIQNLLLWKRYSFFKSLMSRKNGSDKVNERLLFHGTRATDPASIITSEKGFDFRFGSEDCLWGKGTYFAVKASYCDSRFAFHTPRGHRQVFVARVLTGRSVLLPKPNRALKAPPRLPDSPTDSYDSVNGVVENPLRSQVYVVYDHDKAYPAYLITYS